MARKRKTSRGMRRNEHVHSPRATMSDYDSRLVAYRRRQLLGHASEVIHWLKSFETIRETTQYSGLGDLVFAYGNLMKFDCMLGFAGELDLSRDEEDRLRRERNALFDLVADVFWKKFGEGTVIPW